MKKLNIKTAVMAAVAVVTSISAQAEGIGFYALLDGGIAHSSISGGTPISGRTELVTGGYVPNFFGIKGDKDMGQGYTGGFNLETGFLLGKPNNPTAAAGPFAANSRYSFSDQDGLFNRQANLYLSSANGTIKVGTQGNIVFGSALGVDPRGGSNYGSALVSLVAPNGAPTGVTTTDVGSFSYTSPSFGGLTAAVQYKPQNSDTYSGTRVAFNYAQPDWTATFASYSNSNNTSHGYLTGATKKLGDFTFKALYANQTTSAFAPANLAAISGLATTGVGGVYALNAKTSIDFGTYATKKDAFDVKTNAFGVKHQLLKDLTVYGQYANVKNSGTSTAGFNFTPPNDTKFQGTIDGGQTAKTINVGVIFAFF